MKNPLASISSVRRLALFAVALGLIGLFAGDPYGRGRVTLDTRELSQIVQGQLDHVSATEMADWIIEGRSDFRLLDLRSEAEFAQYHIPGAQNVPLTALDDASLLRSEKIVLYSGGGIHSAQAWMLLVAQGYKNVYMLLGGIEAWQDSVLFPSLPANATVAQRADFARMQFVSRHFGGSPQVGSESTSTDVRRELPRVELPQSGVTAPAPSGKKKKEGC